MIGDDSNDVVDDSDSEGSQHAGPLGAEMARTGVDLCGFHAYIPTVAVRPQIEIQRHNPPIHNNPARHRQSFFSGRRGGNCSKV
jgi:hypothetical protein